MNYMQPDISDQISEDADVYMFSNLGAGKDARHVCGSRPIGIGERHRQKLATWRTCVAQQGGDTTTNKLVEELLKPMDTAGQPGGMSSGAKTTLLVLGAAALITTIIIVIKKTKAK